MRDGVMSHPVTWYDAAVAGRPVVVLGNGSGASKLPVDLWRHPRPGDETVICRCGGPTLDVGCGPGRIAHAVAAAGVPALGIDISTRAVAEARSRGAAALRRDVFGRIPGVGRWAHVLLLDGNVGIAGDPVALLRRCRDALRIGGTALVEVDRPGTALKRMSLRLVVEGRVSAPFPWTKVGADAVNDLAAVSGLDVADAWTSHGRWFVALRRGPLIEAGRL
jgi:SAM-dependent methyltransferase